MSKGRMWEGSASSRYRAMQRPPEAGKARAIHSEAAHKGCFKGSWLGSMPSSWVWDWCSGWIRPLHLASLVGADDAIKLGVGMVQPTMATIASRMVGADDAIKLGVRMVQGVDTAIASHNVMVVAHAAG